jgi:SHS2 domain-containing protein
MTGISPGDEGIPVPGVRGLDHTADIALEIMAPDLPELFRRAALATLWLVLGRITVEDSPGEFQGGDVIRRGVELAEEDLSSLLRSWLRTVLLWEDTEGFVVSGTRLALLPTPLCGAPNGQGFGLMGRVEGRFDDGPRIREIKGVTLHGLAVERAKGVWTGRVIFDV